MTATVPQELEEKRRERLRRGGHYTTHNLLVLVNVARLVCVKAARTGIWNEVEGVRERPELSQKAVEREMS